jgi:hypothetical protein
MNMEAKIALLEQHLKNLALRDKFKDLFLAASMQNWNGCNNLKPVTEFLTQVQQCAKVTS